MSSTNPTPDPAGLSNPSTSPESSTQTPCIPWLRFLDFSQSLWNRTRKALKARRKWGVDWRNCVRPGRRFVRLKFDEQHGWRHYVTPGWEWNCWNCKDYSIITEGMMPKLIAEWENEADVLRSRGFERHIKPKPTAQTARCPNCRAGTGEPE
jgi:hypothetical protein